MSDLSHRAEQAAPDEARGLLEELWMATKAGSSNGYTFRQFLDINTPEAHLAAAMMLVPEVWRCGFEQGASCDKEPNKSEVWIWQFDTFYEPDWQLGQETQRSNPDGIRGFAATPALALIAAIARSVE